MMLWQEMIMQQDLANWEILSNSKIQNSLYNIITAISISTFPANRLYIGSYTGEILSINNANTGDPLSTNISTGKNLPHEYINCLAIDPTNADKVIAVFSNYNIPSLFYTTNEGTTWTNVSGNLEQNADGSGDGRSCRWATILKTGGKTTYYVATSTGLYSTSELDGNNTNWAQEGAATIGNVVCPMVVSQASDGLVAVATHGSGIYSANLPVLHLQ